MSIRRLIADKWEGISNKEEFVESPNASQFNRMLDRMDAQTYTMITLQDDGEAHLTYDRGRRRTICRLCYL